MQDHSTPTIANSDKPARTIPRGLGYISIRSTKDGVLRYQARWRVKGAWKSRTFSTHKGAEDWLVAVAPHKKPRINPTHRIGPPKSLDEDIDFGLVYFIQSVDGGLIKIGRAVNPQQRLKTLQSGSPVQLRIVAVSGGGHQAETYLHWKFGGLRAHGEWFHPDKSLLAWVELHATTWGEIFGENEEM